MKTYDLAVIGHVSLDYNIDCRDLLTVQVGGAVVYSSAAAHALGRSVVALTKLAPADEDRLSVFTLPREDIVCLPSSRSTSIENKYFTEDKEKRRCVCLSQGDPFTPADIPGDISAGIWQLGGLIYGDFAEGLTDELARRGEVVEREPRRVFVRSIFAADFDGESFTLACVVSKGTYIRVLAEDIGRALGCGAHLTALRRTRVGDLTLDKAVTIEALEALGTPEAVRAKLTPSDALLSTLARVDLTAPQAERFLLGQRLRLELPADSRVRVYDAAGALLGTASVSERGVLSPVRLIAH